MLSSLHSLCENLLIHLNSVVFIQHQIAAAAAIKRPSLSKHLATAGRKNSSLFKLPLYSLYKAYSVYTGFYIHHIMKLQIQVRAMAMKFSSLVGNPYNYGLPLLGLKHTHRTRVIYNNPNFSRRTFSLLINFFYTKTFNTSTAYVIISKIY